MTATDTVDSFVSVLDGLIEDARSCVRDADTFRAAVGEIETLIETKLPAIATALADTGITDADRAKLKASFEALGALQASAEARVVWSQDFNDYMRAALAGDD